MTDTTPFFVEQAHTKVCEITDEAGRLSSLTASLRSLIRHHIEMDRRCLGDLAAELHISRRQLGRIIGGRKPLHMGELKHLMRLLDIEPARATIAIEMLGDWRRYDDPGLAIMTRLIAPVVTKLNERAEFAIEPLSAAAETKLSDWIADTIIRNEEQIRSRRDDFVKLPTL